MKKIYVFLIVLLSLGLISCGQKRDNPDNPDDPNTQEPNPDNPDEKEYTSIVVESNNDIDVNFSCNPEKVEVGTTVKFTIEGLKENCSIKQVSVYDEVLLPVNGEYSFVAQNKETKVKIVIEETKLLPSLRTVMNNLLKGRNYTYRLEDEIFKTTTIYSFTANAYYFTYSKDNSAQGYASDKDGKVFEYTLDDSGVVPGDYLKNKNGEIITRLWEDAIVSFEDFNINALSDEVSNDNTYLIEDESNRTLFALFAGYADVYVMPYVTVSVEVLSDTTFKSTVHFEPENEKYIGDCYGYIELIDDTVIPYIDDYINNGGTAKEDVSAGLVDLLGKIKASKNYTITVINNETISYVDTFTEKYFYSENKIDDSKSKGNILLVDKIFKFTIKNNSVALESEISYTNNAHDDLWANSSTTFRNLSNINLSNFTIFTNEDGKLALNNNYSVMSTLYYLTHPTAAFPTVDTEKDLIIFDSFDESGFTYTYCEANGNKTSVKISDIDKTSIPFVDEYIESASSFDENDLSRLNGVFNSLKNSKEYTISFKNNFGFGILSTNCYDISFSENEYHSLCTNNDSLEYSYYLENGKVMKKTKTSSTTYGVEETDKTELWGSGLFASFLEYDETTLVGKQKAANTYVINNVDFLKFLGKLVYIDSKDLTDNFSTLNIILNEDEKIVEISAQSSWYGGFTFKINY